MAKYRKKPVIIEAKQYNGKNAKEIAEWMGSGNTPAIYKDIIVVYTLEGQMTAQKDDWIIKGVKNEFYPCKPDIFEQTYEKVGE